MSQKLLHLVAQRWIFFVAIFVIFDILVVIGLLLLFVAKETERVAAAELAQVSASPTATATPLPTPTLWPGPPPTLTPTPTAFPTPEPTDVLAESGFPPGFTPTPRPTREPVMITLPIIAPVFASSVDVPVINQIYYPEPFFPTGSNNACGPVALFAALHALGGNVNYTRLRDVAVQHGFTSYGISKWGLINTATTLNYELGSPFAIEHGNHYATKDLVQQIQRGGVAIVLIRVRKENGRYVVTADKNNSIGHFLIVEKINMRSRTVHFAGSTLGMDKVPLQDFLQSWASNPEAVSNATKNWQSYLRREQGVNWALIIKPRS